jgi:hypothetical protein
VGGRASGRLKADAEAVAEAAVDVALWRKLAMMDAGPLEVAEGELLDTVLLALDDNDDEDVELAMLDAEEDEETSLITTPTRYAASMLVLLRSYARLSEWLPSLSRRLKLHNATT